VATATAAHALTPSSYKEFTLSSTFSHINYSYLIDLKGGEKMTQIKKKNEQSQIHSESQGKKGGAAAGAYTPNRVAVGTAGAIAGAAIGSLAAIALSDKNTREKLSDIMQDLPKKANDTLDVLEEKADQLNKAAKSNIEETRKLTQKNHSE